MAFRSKKYRTKCIAIVDALGDAPDLIMFDLETTGLSPKTSRIIEFAGIRYRVTPTGLLDEVDNLHLYINPGFEIRPEIEEITKITNKFLQDKPFEEEVFPAIAEFLGRAGRLILSGYNIDNFDIKFMKELYARYGAEWPCVDTIDVIEMARDIFPPSEVANYKLGTIADACDFADGVQFHSAIEDTRVTAKVFQICFLNYRADIIDEQKAASIAPAKQQPKVLSVNFWEGYRGMSRIYVDLDCGKVYYDIVKKSWFPKNEETDINAIDMELVERECLFRAGTDSLAEFVRIEADKKKQPKMNSSMHTPAVSIQVTNDKITPDILSVCFWEGFKGWARIYVNTSHGNIYLNVHKMQWEPKGIVEKLDIGSVERKCFELTGTTSLAEFSTFTGRIFATR